MRFLLQFSGEHDKLPRAELTAVLEGEGFRFEFGRVFREKRMILVDVDCPDGSFISRLAYTQKAHRVLEVAQRIEPLAEKAVSLMAESDTFRTTASSQILERRLGALIARSGFHVSLERPDKVFSVFEERGICILGEPISLEKDFEKRKPQHRPFFHPTSLHPKLARCLVNLCRVRAGDTVLDPFVGTGGILVEAGLMGLKLKGWDVKEEMVEGCMMNFKHFSLVGGLEKRDALRDGKDTGFVDAIVTDPPYGRGSYSSVGNPYSLYQSFLSEAKSWIASGRFLVVVFPSEFVPPLEGWRRKESFEVYIHKSLTRKIWVLEKT
ncbi:MAG: DNA methyltransferase [Candidatus Altiarchaeota archaeon]